MEVRLSPPKQAGCTVNTSASRLAALWKVVNQNCGGKRRLFLRQRSVENFAARWICLVGSPAGKGRLENEYLQTSDAVDSWKVIIVEPEKQLTLLFGMKAPGAGRR